MHQNKAGVRIQRAEKLKKKGYYNICSYIVTCRKELIAKCENVKGSEDWKECARFRSK